MNFTLKERDEKYDEKRASFREPVNITVDYVTAGRIRNDFIRDLSDEGVFIETSENLEVGDYIVLAYTDPFTDEIVKIGGVVVRKADNGVGVKLNLRSRYDKEKALKAAGETDVMRPEIWGPWATIGLGLAIGIVWFLTQIYVTDMVIALNLFPDASFTPQPLTDPAGNEGFAFFLAACMASCVCIMMIFSIIRMRRGISVTEYLGLYGISLKTILSAVGITIGFIVVSAFVSITFNKSHNTEFITESIKATSSPMLIFLTLVIAAPVSEEFFFRGFLLEGFRYTWIGNTGAVILTSLAWSMIHLQYDAFGQGTLFVLGILMGTIRIKTGSVWSSVVMHGVNNLVATVMIILYINTL